MRPFFLARRPYLCRVFAALLLLLFTLQAVDSLRRKAVTVDEITYITAGYHHLRTGRFDFNLTNPPLMKMVPALPLLAFDLDLPPIEAGSADLPQSLQWRAARTFLYGNRVDADRMLLAARLPVVLLGIVLGIYVFTWARKLYGDAAGLFALLLYSFSPNILAHTRLATLDLGLTAFMFIFAFHFWCYLRRPTIRGLLFSGLALSAAVLTKTTALFLMPVVVVFAAFLVLATARTTDLKRFRLMPRRLCRGPRCRRAVFLAVTLLALAAIVLVGVNAGYGFEGSLRPYSRAETHPDAYRLLPVDNRLSRGFVDLALETPLPLPAGYVDVIRFQARQTAKGNNVYFAGRTSREGWWFLMPLAFVIKTPIPLLILIAVASYRLVARREVSEAEWLILAICAMVLALFSYLRSVSIGLRYILPIYPFLHVYAASVLREPTRWSIRGKALLLALVAWYLAGAILIHPHYLAYFNEFIGGPRNGYRVLADSFLDWGQDLGGLRDYMKARKIERIRLAYFGSADARYYGIDYDYLPSVGLAPNRPGERWWYETKTEDLPAFELGEKPIAISATLLAGVFFPGYYEELRELEPVDMIGFSILIFDPGRTKEEPTHESQPTD